MPTPKGGENEDARVARTRADVSRAALKVLVESGWDDVTHARVAETAGYSKTTLYTHWPSRFDLIAMALDALGDMPHHQPTGDLRADVAGELQVFRQAITDLGLDRILSGMTLSSSAKEVARLRHRVNTDGQRPLRELLAQRFTGHRLEAAVSMLTGVVACPALMFGDLPADAVISAAIDIVLAAAD